MPNAFVEMTEQQKAVTLGTAGSTGLKITNENKK